MSKSTNQTLTTSLAEAKALVKELTQAGADLTNIADRLAASLTGQPNGGKAKEVKP